MSKVEELEAKLRYLNTIIDAQKTFCAVYDSTYVLEHVNDAFANFLMGADRTKEGFSLTRCLQDYEEYALPSTDRELIRLLDADDDFKAMLVIEYESGAKEHVIFSLELSKFLFFGESKYIIVLTDITACEKAKKREVELLQVQHRYRNDQEISAFMKQSKIIKDEVSHRYSNGWFFDSFFKPLDILSGDTYGSIKISDGLFLFYLIDAMGKGLSASVTSIQATSFINNAIEIAVDKNDFDFKSIISSFCNYIKKQLLDDELLCAAFALFDTNDEKLKYASFAMPPIMLQAFDGSMSKVVANNPPIMAFFDSKNIIEIELGNVSKVMLCSDGLNESVTKSARVYDRFIDADFLNTNTLGDFVGAFRDKTLSFDDDVTIIQMFRGGFEANIQLDLEIDSNRAEIAKAQEYIESVLDGMIDNVKQKASLFITISELIMNAYEHGNLNMSSARKQELIKDGKYDDEIDTLELVHENKNKKICVTIALSNVFQNESKLLLITISDSGLGFDFTEVIKKARCPYNYEYRGRGIKMSLESVGGIYYNSKGKKVTILDTIKSSSNS